MNHEAIQDLVALRLYDEVTADEAAVVERHLAECADCRRLAAEFDAGLGRLIAGRPAPVSSATAPRRRAAGATPIALGSLLGFAAGVLLSWVLTATAELPAVPGTTRDPMVAGLDLRQAPPLATSAGRLALLGRAFPR